MNPAEMKLLQNLNGRIADLTQAIENIQKQVTLVDKFATKEIERFDGDLTGLTAALTGIAENFSPYVSKVVLPEHLRILARATGMIAPKSIGDATDFVEQTVEPSTVPTNPFPFEHGDGVLVLSGIVNRNNLVAVINEAGRVLWPFPKHLFEKVDP